VPFFGPLKAGLAKRYGQTDPRTGPQPPGMFSFGTQLRGGPRKTDAFGRKPAPNPEQLVERYHALNYAMVNRNRDACSSVQIRLMADGSRTQGKPGRNGEPISMSRATGQRAYEMGYLKSKAGINHTYEITNHQLIDTLDNPDPYGNFTREKLIGLVTAYQDVVGHSVLVPEGNGWDWTDRSERRLGAPEFLWVIYPQWAIPTRTTRSPIVDTMYYFADRIPLQSCLWFRHSLSLVDPYGSSFSPTYAGEPYRQQEQELVAILSQQLGIQPRPGVMLTAKDAAYGVNPIAKETLEQDMKRKFASSGAGGLYVNDGAWDVNVLEYPKADVGGMQVAQHDRDNQASIYGQPPTFYTVDSNLANLQAADAQFARFSVEPRMKSLCGTLTWLAKKCDERLFFMHDPVIAEDEEKREKVFTMQLGSARKTINQINADTQESPVPWGDQPWMAGTLKQPDMLVEAHEQSLEQGQAAIDGQDIEGGLAVDQHEHQKGMDKKKLEQTKEERALEDVQSLIRSIRAKINAA
jgi:Phage portal protein